MIKNWKRFNENYDEEMGKVILNVDGRKTTWYYLEDAIHDGLLDETFEMDESMAEDYGETVHNEYIGLEDITDMLRDDFEQEIDNLLTYLYKKDHISDISLIEIEGEDEEGENHEYSYYSE